MKFLLDIWFKKVSNQKLLFLVILFLFYLPFAYFVTKISINPDIESVISGGKEFKELNSIVKNKGLNSSVVFRVKTDNFEQLPDIASILEKDLATIDSNLLIKSFDQETSSRVMFDYYINNFPLLMSDTDYKKATTTLEQLSYLEKLRKIKSSMTSFGGSFYSNIYEIDPLGISSSFFENKNELAAKNNLFFDGQHSYSKTDSSLVLLYKTSFDGIDAEKSLILKDKLKQVIGDFKKEKPNVAIEYFGTFLISAANSEIVKTDTNLISILSITFILLLLILYYRSIITPIFFVLPIFFGLIFSMGIIGALHWEISSLSLVTAAVVLGIVLDYSFHFFTHYKENQDPFETAKGIAAPMLTGSLTTILAFGALIFVNSKILQDFGLIASLTLLGAATFVILFLPLIIFFTNFKFKEKARKSRINLNILDAPTYLKVSLFLIVIIGTIVFAFYSPSPKFTGDLNKISYQPDEIKSLEEKLTGLSPGESQKIYFFLSAENFDTIANTTKDLTDYIDLLEQQKKIESFVGPSDFLIPKQVQIARKEQWKTMWKENFETLEFNKIADSIGFDTAFFEPFNSLRKNPTKIAITEELIAKSPFSNLMELDTNEYKATFIAIVPNEEVGPILQHFENKEHIDLLNRSFLATAIINSVKNDFNFILFTTAGLVFLILLLIYGRIELAILTFLPMVISWIWILGIAGLLGIEFNFVNIVLTTFIFGLGDDFSIFITDGLLDKHKFNKDSLTINRTAINLSAITTIFGTGVLYFAKHPAIHSIAVISVLGIVCILIVSNIIQPLLFDFFVFRRKKKNLPPLSLWNIVISVFVFSYFLLGCLILNIVLLFLIISPFSKAKKRSFLNWLISKFVKSMLYIGFNARKVTTNKKHLDFDKPSIIIANHSSFLDILLMISLSPKVIIMVKDWVYNSPFFGAFVRYAGYVYAGAQPSDNLALIKTRIKEGYSIMIFPEGTRSKTGKMGRFHKGAFFLAKELNLDITPIIINGAGWCIKKNDFILQNGTLHLDILPRINVNEAQWGDSYQQLTKNISKYFKSEFAKNKYSDEFAHNVFHSINGKYKFKGPILEWYFKVKWQFEKQNFITYGKLINDSSMILDIGSGYGYFSFYLASVFENASIDAIDYDSEKSQIAKFSKEKNENINFYDGDIFDMPLKQYTCIFLNDVLHYFDKETQIKLLEKLNANLLQGGQIFIRDGVRKDDLSHKKTETSEFYSTKLGFNKKESEFYFPSQKEYLNFATMFNLKVECKEQDNKLSNQLFIYSKE